MNELERVAVLRRYDILDTEPEAEFDRIAELASRMLGAPIAVIFMADDHRLWPKAAFGAEALARPRSATADNDRLGDAFIVHDAHHDDGLGQHPFVAGPPLLRFIAGAPVRSPEGHVLGGILAGDQSPRKQAPSDALAHMEALARMVEAEVERRLVSRRLQELAERFSDVIEVSSDWVWETGPDHQLINQVSEYPVLKGTLREGQLRWELPGAKPLYGAWKEHIEDLDARREFRNFEYEFLTEDGEHRVFRISGRPRVDATGRFLGYRGAGTDITRQRAETLVRGLNQRLFATSADLILATDNKGYFTLVSPSSMTLLGYTAEELIGQSAEKFIVESDLEMARNEMRRARNGKITRYFECGVLSKDGRAVPFSWSDVWSEPDQHHFLIGRDLSERMAAEERRRDSQRLEAIGQFTGGIAHDFNNILSIIILNLEHAADNLQEAAPAHEPVVSALAASTRGADLVSRLMAYARRRVLKPERTAIDELFDEFAPMLRTTLSRRVPMKLDISTDLRRCLVDRTGLEAAILNLAVNARDAMPDGGNLYITARNRTITPEDAASDPELRSGDWIEIAIRDTGVGMPPHILARVFEPFFTTKEDKGTGLGLATVKAFVDQSGGFLTLSSVVSKGSVFSLYMPASPTRLAGAHEEVQ